MIWYLSEKWVGMMLYVDRFCSDYKYGQEKNRLFLLNWVLLMCICVPLQNQERRGNNDGGYAVSDYLNMKPRFRNMKQLQKSSKMFKQKRNTYLH